MALNIFIGAAICWLFFMLLGAFKRTSPTKAKQINELKEKEKQLKKTLLEVSVKQVIALNGMLENFAISRENYYIELNKVYTQCTEQGIDISILKEIRPFHKEVNKEDLRKRILNTAVVLNESRSMTEEELNEIINKTLDGK